MANTYKYTELFRSFQGEGTHTGKNTMWLRWFMCNLTCNGFGQKDPTDESTYELPYETIDITDITALDQLPVFEFGCDSSYSWAKKYRHLAQDQTAQEIADRLEECLRSDTNPDGKFLHPKSGEETHMCFTGGEPMLKHNQEAIIDVMREFMGQRNIPPSVTIETNGTQDLNFDAGFVTMVDDYVDSYNGELFWSVSPKLHNVSGETNEKAIKPEVVENYWDLSKNCLLYTSDAADE